jgi:YgiT-type zinc finger domain-containing protein
MSNPPQQDVPTAHSLACPQCGSETQSRLGRMTWLEGDQLMLIEDVPVRVCDTCGEEFYDETITYKIDRLRAGLFSADQIKREIRVPVFSWKDL